MAKTKFAFQCRNCGAVEPKEAAGDNALPSACHVCRTNSAKNWIVLADLSDAELKKGFARHGLTRADVEGKTSARKPVHHTRTASETIGSKDR